MKLKNNNSGYIVLIAVLIISLLITITTLATFNQGTQLLQLSGQERLKQQAYLLVQSCTDIGLRELVSGATLTTYTNADYYNVDTNNELVFSSTSSFVSPPSGLNTQYCRLAHHASGGKKVIFAVGTAGSETSEMTTILDINYNLYYQNPGLATQ